MRAKHNQGRLTVVVNLRLPVADDEALDGLAAACGQTKASVTRTCLAAGLKWAQAQVEKGKRIITL